MPLIILFSVRAPTGLGSNKKGTVTNAIVTGKFGCIPNVFVRMGLCTYDTFQSSRQTCRYVMGFPLSEIHVRIDLRF